MSEILREFPTNEILTFWFGSSVSDPSTLAEQSSLWFSGGDELDQKIKQSFGLWFEPLSRLDAEQYESPEQLLAAVLVFDQFSRNCFRGEAEAFAYDVYALDLLDFALESAWDKALHPIECAFLYMPLQHIESLDGQELGVRLFGALAESAPKGYEKALQNTAVYAVEHRDLIARFGRFPHRNEVLKRPASSEERVYLTEGGKRFGQ